MHRVFAKIVTNNTAEERALDQSSVKDSFGAQRGWSVASSIVALTSSSLAEDLASCLKNSTTNNDTILRCLMSGGDELNPVHRRGWAPCQLFLYRKGNCVYSAWVMMDRRFTDFSVGAVC